jgi:hypothetical protein
MGGERTLGALSGEGTQTGAKPVRIGEAALGLRLHPYPGRQSLEEEGPAS